MYRHSGGVDPRVKSLVLMLLISLYNKIAFIQKCNTMLIFEPYTDTTRPPDPILLINTLRGARTAQTRGICRLVSHVRLPEVRPRPSDDSNSLCSWVMVWLVWLWLLVEPKWSTEKLKLCSVPIWKENRFSYIYEYLFHLLERYMAWVTICENTFIHRSINY